MLKYKNTRKWFNGRTAASQAADAGSIPVSRSTKVACHLYNGKLFFFAKSLETARFLGFFQFSRYSTYHKSSAVAVFAHPIIILCTPPTRAKEE